MAAGWRLCVLPSHCPGGWRCIRATSSGVLRASKAVHHTWHTSRPGEDAWQCRSSPCEPHSVQGMARAKAACLLMCDFAAGAVPADSGTGDGATLRCGRRPRRAGCSADGAHGCCAPQVSGGTRRPVPSLASIPGKPQSGTLPSAQVPCRSGRRVEHLQGVGRGAVAGRAAAAGHGAPLLPPPPLWRA